MSAAMRSRVALYHIFILFCIHQASSDVDESNSIPKSVLQRPTSGCLLPTDRKNMIFRYSIGKELLAPGSIVRESKSIQILCEPGYIRVDQQNTKFYYCINGSFPSMPYCKNVDESNSTPKPVLQRHPSGCLLPTDRNMIFRSSTSKELLAPGSIVPEFQSIEILCEPGYFRVDYHRNTLYYCILGNIISMTHCRNVDENGCLLPTDRNMIFRNSASKELLAPGSIVPDFSSIEILCEPGYFRVGHQNTKFHYCIAGTILLMTHCKKYCSGAKLFRNPSFSPESCKLDNKPVPCDGPLTNGTRVTMVCNRGYTSVSVGPTQWTCESNFEWSGPKPQCEHLLPLLGTEINLP